MRLILLVLFGIFPLVTACGGDDGAATTPDTAADTANGEIAQDGDGGGDAADAAADALAADTVAPRERVGCGSGGWALAEGLVELGWDDGVATGDVTAQDWSVTLEDGVTYSLATGPAWEAVRFELPHPARVHGFSVQWANVPADESAELVAGLYPDFGYNGFDFRHDAPLWQGTRCAGEAGDGAWVSYAFEVPVEVAQPGLVYVAQLRPDAAAPAWRFDSEVIEDCAPFDACRSSVNLPEAALSQYAFGTTLQFPRDFMVRLQVEYLEERPAEARLFQALAEPAVSSRTSFGDYDGDGWDDLLTSGPRLYRNAEGAGFTDVTAAAGLAVAGVAGSGGVWGDYDNDGCLDLFLFAESVAAGDTLMHARCDGTFEEATVAAGIDDRQSYDACELGEAGVHAPSAAAAWVDLDGDGWLDLYVANFICWSSGGGYADMVFHNRGDGTFEDWTATHGFSAMRTPSRGANPVDADGDGHVDLLINNYRLLPNLWFVNQGDGSVVEEGALSGLAGHLDYHGGFNYYGHSIGTAWGDLDGDGDLDAVVANLAHPRFYGFSDKTQLMMNDGAGRFVDANTDWSGGEFSGAGLRYQETHSVPALADFDQDGALDLVITCVYDGRPTDFYWGRGDGTFALDSYGAGITTENGWGVATADVDHDGDVDLATSALFENTGTAAPGHWLSVAVIGDAGANWAALGATVRVTAGGRTWLRYVEGGSGQGCQSSRYLHFGLGAAAVVTEVSVTFPGGQRVQFDGPITVDQRVWLTQSGTLTPGWAPPSR